LTKGTLPDETIRQDIQAVEEYDFLHDDVHDAIVALEIIEHVKNYRLVLKNWLKMLNSGGILILSTPNARYSRKQSHKSL